MRKGLRRRGEYDWVLFFVILFLAGWGIFHLYTITFPGERAFFFRQIIWVAAGIGFLFLFSFFSIRFWGKAAYFIYGISLLTLVLVLFTGEGVHEAQRWLKIGMASFQPSEFAKLGLILVLARLLSAEEEISWKRMGISFCFTFILLILVAIQPDMGTALISPFLWIGMIFLAGISISKLLSILGAGLSFLPLSQFFLQDYQKMRILTFLNPGRDPLGAGWSTLQSRITLGSGRLIGKGIGGAIHTQLKFLPHPFTDFVFASFGEEWGFVGILLLLGLYLIIILRGIKIMRESASSFGRLVSGGIVILFFLHIFINAGMSAGIMPVTGLPLPLVSYGGSSTIMFFLGIGILFSIKMQD
ncbi:MAG: rod shape-determining protein RodA [Candidatus Aerophobetes bacterium]|nr:rod shape-determining protein RodA [Candidatus Aerophobetes bacterium]